MTFSIYLHFVLFALLLNIIRKRSNNNRSSCVIVLAKSISYCILVNLLFPLKITNNLFHGVFNINPLILNKLFKILHKILHEIFVLFKDIHTCI